MCGGKQEGFLENTGAFQRADVNACVILAAILRTYSTLPNLSIRNHSGFH